MKNIKKIIPALGFLLLCNMLIALIAYPIKKSYWEKKLGRYILDVNRIDVPGNTISNDELRGRQLDTLYKKNG